MKILGIIITYNAVAWIDKCLQSLQTGTVAVTTFVVDNASGDETVKHIENHYPNVILQKNKTNIGFGPANNIGMRYAIQQDYDAVLLLNQDAYLHPAAIEKLLPFINLQQHVGIWSPFHKNYNGTGTEIYFDEYILQKYTPGYLNDNAQKSKAAFYKSSFIHAACWLMPISTLKKVGGFDPLFFHYAEDNDFIQRMHWHNLFIGFVTDSFVFHKGSNVTMYNPELSMDYWTNKQLLLLKQPHAGTIGALALFFKTGILQLSGNNKFAKQAFKKNLNRLFKIISSRKLQSKKLAYLQ